MLRNSLLRRSRNLVPQSLPSRPYFYQSSRSPSLRTYSPKFASAASRPYSSAAEASSNASPSEPPPSSTSSQSPPQSSEVDPAKSELEAKNKEIIDLKVRPLPCKAMDTSVYLFASRGRLQLPRTNTSAPSPTSVISKIAQPATSNPPVSSRLQVSHVTSSRALTISIVPSPPSTQHPFPGPTEERRGQAIRSSMTYTRV